MVGLVWVLEKYESHVTRQVMKLVLKGTKQERPRLRWVGGLMESRFDGSECTCNSCTGWSQVEKLYGQEGPGPRM